MKLVFYILLPGFLFFSSDSAAQLKCASFQYQQRFNNSPAAVAKRQQLDDFIQERLRYKDAVAGNERPVETAIKIPVVVHIVYHVPGENIPDETVFKQVAAMNRDFRKRNKDTLNTPAAFKQHAADCNIEFELAKTDPAGRATTGIERLYSPVISWEADDLVKYRSKSGADAWDSRYYFNIWICNLDRVLGYSSVPGDDPAMDGIVLNVIAVQNKEDGSAYGLGRAAVHETGHWLGLKHLWGDADCGDDGVDDTPKQTGFTPGCPRDVRISCNQSAAGDMYMNFMDYTDDPCTNLFTKGQRDRMRVLFEDGGPRETIRSSPALGLPWVEAIPLPDDTPQWLYPQVYPNPSTGDITIDIRYDPRWTGQTLSIVNASGQLVMKHVVISPAEKLDISRLKPGVYFICGKKDNEKLLRKFVKM